jgi:hypothetical protein
LHALTAVATRVRCDAEIRIVAVLVKCSGVAAAAKKLPHGELKTSSIATNFRFYRKIGVTDQILDAE